MLGILCVVCERRVCECESIRVCKRIECVCGCVCMCVIEDECESVCECENVIKYV